MIVIADNSPLSALAEIGQLEILKRLYGRIVVPESVAREATVLTHEVRENKGIHCQPE